MKSLNRGIHKESCVYLHVFNIGCNYEDGSQQLTGLPAKLVFFMNVFESFPADSSPEAKTILYTPLGRALTSK